MKHYFHFIELHGILVYITENKFLYGYVPESIYKIYSFQIFIHYFYFFELKQSKRPFIKVNCIWHKTAIQYYKKH